MREHASMLGAADAPKLDALATFVDQLAKDVGRLAQQSSSLKRRLQSLQVPAIFEQL